MDLFCVPVSLKRHAKLPAEDRPEFFVRLPTALTEKAVQDYARTDEVDEHGQPKYDGERLVFGCLAYHLRGHRHITKGGIPLSEPPLDAPTPEPMIQWLRENLPSGWYTDLYRRIMQGADLDPEEE